MRNREAMPSYNDPEAERAMQDEKLKWQYEIMRSMENCDSDDSEEEKKPGSSHKKQMVFKKKHLATLTDKSEANSA